MKVNLMDKHKLLTDTDTINHDILINKLEQNGIMGIAVNWVKDI